MRILRAAASLSVSLLAAGCAREQSVFAPGGPAAERLAELGGAVIGTFVVVALVMWALLAWVATRRRGTLDEHEPADAGAGGGHRWILIGGFAIPAVILAAVFIAALSSMSAFPLHDHAAEPGLVRTPDIEVTAHQWWWNAEYLGEALCRPAGSADPTLPYRVTTANEIHVPVGMPVEIGLRSADVIHSFWVPQLHGKVDVVPGQENRIRILATEPGRYRGQCAEFCGEQHAHMILYVVADPPEQFFRWVANQRAAAREPQTAEQRHGREVFETKACVVCHTIRGTRASATIGPDLTHLANRTMIAAGSYPNNPAYLSAWVTHAQSLKEGAAMPDLTVFSGEDLRALVAYLESLK